MALLVLGAWQISRQKFFAPGSNLGYWLGVAGGSAMLALFLYPLRKHVRWMRGLGPVKYWFLFHMVCGVAGPLLILLHSTFHVGSMNAAIALTSMLLVAASGIVGRFIYVRIHRGLLGEKSTLRELHAGAGFQHDTIKSKFHFAPEVERHLFAFEAGALRDEAGWSTHLRQVFVLPWLRWITYWRCVRVLDRHFADFAQRAHWDLADLKQRRRRARKLVRAYLSSVQRVAQFTAYDRLFSLWHVLHIPFVYVMLVTAVVHVVAVHAY